jgi:hypothetical protein
MRLSVLLLLFVAVLAVVPSDAANAGEPTTMAFLKMGAGADAIGMGDAVVSSIDGPNATYWNAGATGFLPGIQATVVHNESFQSVRQEFAGLTKSFGRWAVGGSFLGTWTENMDSYDESANYLGKFAYYGFAAGVTGARKLNDTWGVGVTVKYVRDAFDVYSASGMAVDLGIQGREVFPRLGVGLSVLHLGSKTSYVEKSYDLPRTIQGGVSYTLPLSSLGSEALVAAEVRTVLGEETSLLTGIEYRVKRTAHLRVGYRSGMDTQDVSFGVGFQKAPLVIDYAYVPFGEDLGAQHRIGLTYRH